MRKLDPLQNLLQEIQETILPDQPRLKAFIYGCLVIVEGTFDVMHTAPMNLSEDKLDDFQIRLQFTSNFPAPNGEPRLFEISEPERIPKIPDRHVNPDGSCCFEIWERWLVREKNPSAKTFFDGPINDYFFGQHYFEKRDVWPGDEHAHGKPGVIKCFAKILGCQPNETEIIDWLRLLSKPKIRGHLPCPCNSKKNIRDCCANNYREPPVSQPLAEKMHQRLEGFNTK